MSQEDQTAVISDEEIPIDAVENSTTIAVLNVSGELIEVGYTDQDTVYIKPALLDDPIYMSVHDVEMLIASLRVAKYEALGEPRT